MAAPNNHPPSNVTPLAATRLNAVDAARAVQVEPEADLRAALRLLWRRRWLIAGSVALGLSVAALTLTLMTPRYTAMAQVMVDPRQTNVLDVEQVLSGLPANAETIQSEIEVLTSRDLAQRVVAETKLDQVPEFNPALRPASWPLLSAAPLDTAQQSVAVTDRFLRRLQVRAAGRSRVIDISFTSSSPALAAAIANKMADLYLVEQLEAKFEATRHATQWLSGRLDELRSKAEAAEQAAEQFRKGVSGGISGAGPADAGQDSSARLRSLEREAQATRALYETVLARFKETSEQQGLEQADARIISRADVPVTPSFPDQRLVMLLALMGSLGLGVLLAFAAEKLDAGFRSTEQLEQQLGLPTLAMIPSLASLGQKRSRPEEYLVSKPNSSFAEAVRMLRTALLLTHGGQPARVLLVTSALPCEGKTTTALALARMTSMSGDKAVVIDADLRRPRVHSALGVENRQGLAELLDGTATIEQVLRSVEVNGRPLYYITAGQSNPNATELVRSRQMQLVLRGLAATFPLVIIDSPPVLPVADAKVLASMADKVLYVLRWRDTPREVVAHAVRQLRDVGGNIAGAVFNGLDVRRHAEYSYGDSGYYYGRYRKYYVD